MVSLYAFFSAWGEKADQNQKIIFLIIWSIIFFLPYAYTFSHELFVISTCNSFGTFYYFAGSNDYFLLGNFFSKRF
ncbi:hypothetical protein BWG23_15290 [Flavobacterium oreochromis]|nr:hypothetical protein BWG23_15290 [Flavobacterium oreochromis]